MLSFVQEIEGIDFLEALRILAARAGVAMNDRPEPGRADNKKERATLLAITELAAKFFEKQLWSSNAGAKALAYLRGRGMTDETIKAWRLGWAPNDWRALTTFLAKAGHANRSIVAAGMAVDREGRPYDRFRSRIMFPINDANAQVVGFTGRVFGAEVAVEGDAVAKYVNTPQTAIYDKGRVLFGLDKAKLEMRKRGVALLVEGNVDAIMSWQIGATNVVATSGTALTPHQLKMLSRHATTLDFCFDTDQAGQVATRRGIGLALAQSFTVRMLTITDADCKDPADYIAKHGAAWHDVVLSAKPAVQYYYDQALTGYDPASAESKKAVLALIGPLVKHLGSRVEQSHWVNQLAALLRTNRRAVEADLATIRDDLAVERSVDETPKAAPQLASKPMDSLNEGICTLLAFRPALAEHIKEHLYLLDERVLSQSKENASYIRAEQIWSGSDDTSLQAEMEDLIRKLRIRGLKSENAQSHAAVVTAEARRDRKAVHELMQAIDERNRQIKLLSQ